MKDRPWDLNHTWPVDRKWCHNLYMVPKIFGVLPLNLGCKRRLLPWLQWKLLRCCVCWLSLGLSTEGNTDAVGEPYHGHAGVSGACHRAADRGDAETQAIRTHKAADLEDDDEEHNWSCHLPADCHLYHPLCRSRSPSQPRVVLKHTCIASHLGASVNQQSGDGLRTVDECGGDECFDFLSSVK